MRTATEVAVFVTRRGDREVLLVHRSPVQGGYWHVVAGGIEPGETAVDAAARELREETGLSVEMTTNGVEVTELVDPRTKRAPARGKEHEPSIGQLRVTCFRIVALDDWEPELDWEHDGYRWCSPEEALEALSWPGTAQGLRTLLSVETV